MPFWGKVLFVAGFGALLHLMMFTLVTGTFFATVLAAVLLRCTRSRLRLSSPEPGALRKPNQPVVRSSAAAAPELALS